MPFMLRFADFFRTRSDQNKSVYNYLLGFIQGKRGAKNMERMEVHVEGFSYQKAHNSLSESPWDHRPLMDEVAKQAGGLLSGGRRVRLIYDPRFGRWRHPICRCHWHHKAWRSLGSITLPMQPLRRAKPCGTKHSDSLGTSNCRI
jgi:hypothetical protein